MSELLTASDWDKYRKLLRKISVAAEKEFVEACGKLADGRVANLLLLPRTEVIDAAYAITTKYGEASAEAACQMHDLIAKLSGVSVPPAEPAAVAEYAEVAKAVNGAAKVGNEKIVTDTVGRLVRQVSQDTTHKNAVRDHAEWAWIPSGETCAFCLTLASNGWQDAGRADMESEHVAHIHPNCDCAYAVRFKSSDSFGGYNPNKYKSMYDRQPGKNSKERMNALRRELYEENADEINAQKREAYALRKEE